MVSMRDCVAMKGEEEKEPRGDAEGTTRSRAIDSVSGFWFLISGFWFWFLVRLREQEPQPKKKPQTRNHKPARPETRNLTHAAAQ